MINVFKRIAHYAREARRYASDKERLHYEAQVQREKRRDLIEGAGGPPIRDQETIEHVINRGLQESRILGYEHDIVVLTPLQFKVVVGIPAGYTIEESSWDYSRRRDSSRLTSHEWDHPVRITYSDTVDQMILLDSEKMGPTPKDF